MYKQLFNFHYSDGAKMLTVGGIVYDRGQSGIVAKCDFDEMPFVASGAEPYKIATPCLTYRERRRLDAKLPIDAGASLADELGIPRKHLDMYAKVYRYFPNFAETEL